MTPGNGAVPVPRPPHCGRHGGWWFHEFHRQSWPQRCHPGVGGAAATTQTVPVSRALAGRRRCGGNNSAINRRGRRRRRLRAESLRSGPIEDALDKAARRSPMAHAQRRATLWRRKECLLYSRQRGPHNAENYSPIWATLGRLSAGNRRTNRGAIRVTNSPLLGRFGGVIVGQTLRLAPIVPLVKGSPAWSTKRTEVRTVRVSWAVERCERGQTRSRNRF